MSAGLGRIQHGEFAMGCREMSESEFTAFLEAAFRLLAEKHHSQGDP